MSRSELQTKLDEIRAVRTEVLQCLQDVPDTDTDLETPDLRTWHNLGIVLLRFGDHMREHGNQIANIRQALGNGPTDVQRKLGAAEAAWGELLGVVTGLTDSDLDAVPEAGGLVHPRDPGSHSLGGDALSGRGQVRVPATESAMRQPVGGLSSPL